MNVRRIITTAVLTAATAVILAGCGPDKTADKPGEPGVYTTIDLSTSCTQLQGMFDSYASLSRTYIYNGDARKDNTMAYMKYAQARMDTLNCYG